jgi:hypothetical protein
MAKEPASKPGSDHIAKEILAWQRPEEKRLAES